MTKANAAHANTLRPTAPAPVGRQPRAATPAAAVALLVVGLLAAPLQVRAQLCTSSWPTITVSPSSVTVSALSDYTIATMVPNVSGCDLTTLTLISIGLPADTNAGTITTGTLNGSAISFLTKSGQTVTFLSPVGVAFDQPVTIVLNSVTNPTTPGAQTLTLAASLTQLGSISQTTSQSYTISLPTLTPTVTATTTLTPTSSATLTRTATSTVTDTPVATVTPTSTLTATSTQTVTPTQGPCNVAAPGNPCIPGGGGRGTDCISEWVATPQPASNRSGFPGQRLVCTEGDPTCDFDTNIGSCTFHVRLCFNNTDPRLQRCTPSDVASFAVRLPNPQRLRDAADSVNLAALTSAFPGATSALNRCSDLLDIQVPLRALRSGRFTTGRKSLRVRTTTSLGQVDTDSLRLTCRPSTCGNGHVEPPEQCDDGNRISGDGCSADCRFESSPTSTSTPTVTNTATPNGPTGTPTNTAPPTQTPSVTTTPSITSTPTITPTFPPAVCGNGIVEPPAEECDDGGICIGGSNAGTTCTAESDCIGHGVCVDSAKYGTECASDSDCPGGRCVHCKPFGGDGCSANCTQEYDVTFTLVNGVVSNNQIQPGTSGATVHSNGIIKQIPIPLSGTQNLTVGKTRDGVIPVAIKAASVNFPRAQVSTIACACVRAIPAKSCGGTVFDADGSISTDCTPDYTAGDSVCTGAGKNPCAFVHGPGNSASGRIGCDGLDGINLTYFQDSRGNQDPPECSTTNTTPCAAPPVITLDGTGGPGSAMIINSTAIGQVTGNCSGSGAAYGPDGKFCTNDDPQSSRGQVQTLPAVTGNATSEIDNINGANGTNLGPYTVSGSVFSCAAIAAPTPSLSGAGIAVAFTAPNQPTLQDIAVTSTQVAQ